MAGAVNKPTVHVRWKPMVGVPALGWHPAHGDPRGVFYYYPCVVTKVDADKGLTVVKWGADTLSAGDDKFWTLRLGDDGCVADLAPVEVEGPDTTVFLEVVDSRGRRGCKYKQNPELFCDECQCFIPSRCTLEPDGSQSCKCVFRYGAQLGASLSTALGMSSATANNRNCVTAVGALICRSLGPTGQTSKPWELKTGILRSKFPVTQGTTGDPCTQHAEAVLLEQLLDDQFVQSSDLSLAAERVFLMFLSWPFICGSCACAIMTTCAALDCSIEVYYLTTQLRRKLRNMCASWQLILEPGIEGDIELAMHTNPKSKKSVVNPPLVGRAVSHGPNELRHLLQPRQSLNDSVHIKQCPVMQSHIRGPERQNLIKRHLTHLHQK